MTPEVEGVLVPLSLIFVFEPVFAILALVLLLHLMSTTKFKSVVVISQNLKTYFRSSSVSNFFGFFGQHSHINTP
jgi:hypothetical protein